MPPPHDPNLTRKRLCMSINFLRICRATNFHKRLFGTRSVSLLPTLHPSIYEYRIFSSEEQPKKKTSATKWNQIKIVIYGEWKRICIMLSFFMGVHTQRYGYRETEKEIGNGDGWTKQQTFHKQVDFRSGTNFS